MEKEINAPLLDIFINYTKTKYIPKCFQRYIQPSNGLEIHLQLLSMLTFNLSMFECEVFVTLIHLKPEITKEWEILALFLGPCSIKYPELPARAAKQLLSSE